MVLCTVTLNFFCLDYILPGIGIILMLLGFRSLRAENRYFKTCWVITVMRAVYFGIVLAVNAASCHGLLYACIPEKVLAMVTSALVLLPVAVLGRGTEEIQKKSGLTPNTGSITALLVWHIALQGLGYMHYGGGVLGLGAVVLYCFIVYKVYRTWMAVEENGVSVNVPCVKVTDQALTGICLLAVTVGIAVSYACFSRYPMQWTAVVPAAPESVAMSEKQEKAALTEMVVDAGELGSSENITGPVRAEDTAAPRERLRELGFPEEVLADLTAEDILACGEAVRVVVQQETYPVNDGKRMWFSDDDQVCELRMIGAAVELSEKGEGGRGGTENRAWKLFHHFEWSDQTVMCGTEAVQILPASGNHTGYRIDGDFSGRVLYDEEGITYAAPFFSLGAETDTYENVTFGNSTSESVYAAFSFPRGGKKSRRRGYASYEITDMGNEFIISSRMNYIHQRDLLQYPAQTAVEFRKNSSGFSPFSSERVFCVVQDELQVDPLEELRAQQLQ